MKKTFLMAIYPYLLKQYNIMFETIQKKYQITQIEIDVLAFLANNPEYYHAQDIVNIRGISKAYVSCSLDKLVKRGLVERQVDNENRRCNCLFVTPYANELIKEIRAVQDNYNEIAYQGLSNQDKEQFNRLISQIYENLGGNNNE